MLVNFMVIRPILLPVRIFYGVLVYFVVILVHFPPILVCCTKKNLATLQSTRNMKPTLERNSEISKTRTNFECEFLRIKVGKN
jgi:hypothetical protein